MSGGGVQGDVQASDMTEERKFAILFAATIVAARAKSKCSQCAVRRGLCGMSWQADALKSLRSAQLGFGIFDSRPSFANPILCLFCTDGGGTLLFKAGFLLAVDLCAQSLNFGRQSSGSHLLLAQLQLVRNRIDLDKHFATVNAQPHAKTCLYHTPKKRRFHGVGGAVEFHAGFLRNLVQRDLRPASPPAPSAHHQDRTGERPNLVVAAIG